MDGYVRAGVMVLTEQVKSISNSRNKDQKSISCSWLLMWIKTRRHQFKSEKLRKERWPLLNTYYGQDILRAAMVWIWNIPPKAHVFEHLVQAKNAVWEGCRTFRKRRKKRVGTWAGLEVLCHGFTSCSFCLCNMTSWLPGPSALHFLPQWKASYQTITQKKHLFLNLTVVGYFIIAIRKLT